MKKFGYREVIESSNENGEKIQHFQNRYFFSSDMREDTFALAQVFIEILDFNKGQINPQNPKVRKISQYVERICLPEHYDFFKVPASQTFFDKIREIVEAENDIQVNQVDITLAHNPHPDDNMGDGLD